MDMIERKKLLDSVMDDLLKQYRKLGILPNIVETLLTKEQLHALKVQEVKQFLQENTYHSKGNLLHTGELWVAYDKWAITNRRYAFQQDVITITHKEFGHKIYCRKDEEYFEDLGLI